MEYAIRILPEIAYGLWQTVAASLAGIAIGMVLGLFIALMRRSRFKVVRWPTTSVTEFIRSTPLLIQLFFLYYVMPTLGWSLSSFATLVVGLGIHYATYASEGYRAGIDNVALSQWEASTAINLSTRTTWTRVVLPQAIPTVLPALGNNLVSMFKDAPIGSAIAAGGILMAAQSIASRTFQPVEPYMLTGLLFLAVSIPSAVFVRYLERRLGYQRT